jgi:hypothetical protein
MRKLSTGEPCAGEPHDLANSRIDELLPLAPEWIVTIKQNKPEKATWGG